MRSCSPRRTAIGLTSGLTSVPSFLIRIAFFVAMGNGFRHVRIAQPADLEVHSVRELVRAAIAQAERPEGKLGKPCIVVRRAQYTKTGSNRSRRRT